MRLRILLEPHHGASYAQILALAQAAEAGGFDAFFRSDHYLGIDADDTSYQPTDSWTTLAGLAVQTERVRIGTLVNASTFRLPGQLAVEVATVDQMSGGRAELGIGAAWYEREHHALGVHYPEMKHRFEMLEETLQIARQMWSADEGPYDGKYYHLAETICSPRPIQEQPPILIGGSGEKKTLRLVARYGDATNLFGGDIDTLKHKLDVLRGHCDAVGRDFDDIEQTVLCLTDPVSHPDQFWSEVEQYAALGFDEVKMSAKTANPPAWMTEVVEKVLPRLSEI